MKDSISRRNFITKSAAGAGALSIGPMNKVFAGNNEQKKTAIDPNTSSREILVQSISNPDYTQDGNYENDVQKIFNILDRTSSYEPDIITIPEVFANQPDTAQKIPGPISNTFSNYAKQHRCYVICGLYTLRENKIYNSAVLIDRKGDISGIYDKIYPTERECDKGVTPGVPNPKVFQTDFGKIGILICFDINWPEVWGELKEGGAEIVFWPSAYPNPALLSARARLQDLARRLQVAAFAEHLRQALVVDLRDVDRGVPRREQRRGADAAAGVDLARHGVEVVAEQRPRGGNFISEWVKVR